MATTTGVDAFAPAHAMLEALRSGTVSSRELTELHLRRIESYNARLNAIVVPGPDPMGAATAADRHRRDGQNQQLLGLPVTLKESMNVPGLPTTVGLPEFKDFRAHDTGAVPSKVLGAGAVLLGKTNVPPMLSDWQSTNPVYGRTVNPWDATRTPGGSTGGGAAAVAAGLSPLEFGSDIGGSIRVPAAFCGIFGHKPSETLVPRSGQFPRPSTPNAAVVLGVQGPLARTAEDLELALRVIAGAEVGEDLAWRIDLPPPRREGLPGLRVAVMPKLDWLPVSEQIVAALDELASRLSGAGATVKVTAPEALGDMREHHACYLTMLNAFTLAHGPVEEREREAELMKSRPDLPWAAAKEAAATAVLSDWLRLHARREEYRRAYRDFFKDWDILLTPMFLRTAFPHIDLPWPPKADGHVTMLDVDGKAHPYEDGLVYPGLATLSGQPGTCFPVGLASDGLPIGLQAIGPYLEDLTPIRFSGLATELMDGYRRPPGF
jgi:amidase